MGWPPPEDSRVLPFLALEGIQPGRSQALMRGSRLLRAVAVLVIAAAIIVATPPPARAFAIPPQIVFSVTVTSSDDTDDGTCDASHCSVREAINFTNTNPIFSLIKFNIPAAGLQQITLQAPLPPITDPVTLDGRTQPGWAGAPLILVDGSNAISTGLAINAASTTVAGLAIVRFTGRGLDLAGGATRLLSNYVGVIPSGGGIAAPNGTGIWVGSSANFIGGDHTSLGNVISGNENAGIVLEVAGNTIQGNRIGAAPSGNGLIGNGTVGIGVVAGPNVIADNIIAGNAGGIAVGSGVGTDILGNSIHSNASFGILLTGFDPFVPPNDPGDGDSGPNDL